jgi:hypothetical protein
MIPISPEYIKGGGGGGHHSRDNSSGDSVPSGDATLIVSVVETYVDDKSYSAYELSLGGSLPCHGQCRWWIFYG